MTPTVLELRHVACETVGAYRAGVEQVADLHTVSVWREPLPHDPTDYAAIIVMGGPMGANDGPRLPWIDDEIEFLRAAIRAGVPIWGACLGSQLLAKALGAAVRTGPAPELGICDVTITDAGRLDPVWSLVPGPTLAAMQWHYDTFDLPPGATLLASSPAYPHQLFRHGNCYGAQFHLEVDATLFDQWLEVPEYREELVTALGPDAPMALFAAVERAEEVTAPLAAALIRRWFEEYAGSPAAETA